MANCDCELRRKSANKKISKKEEPVEPPEGNDKGQWYQCPSSLSSLWVTLYFGDRLGWDAVTLRINATKAAVDAILGKILSSNDSGHRIRLRRPGDKMERWGSLCCRISIFFFLFDALLWKNIIRHFDRIKRLEHLHGYFMFNQQPEEPSPVHLISYCIIQFLNDPSKLSQITSVSSGSVEKNACVVASSSKSNIQQQLSYCPYVVRSTFVPSLPVPQTSESLWIITLNLTIKTSVKYCGQFNLN